MGTTSRIRHRGRYVLLGCIVALSAGQVQAQDARDESPPIALRGVNVNATSTRLIGTTRAPSRIGAPARRYEPAPDAGPATPSEASPDGGASGIITGTIITGASSTVITSQDIQRSPGRTLQDVLAHEPGIQVTSLFGGVNGTQTTVDMRGFGAAAASNTLVLINGRRLNDVDLAGIDLSALPRDSIERVEVTRGNSGTVAYGDGAVGGVINIVTKTGVGLPPSARVQGSFGSFNYREGNASANTSSGPWAVSAFANAIGSDGYRENNKLRQEGAVGSVRYAGDQGSGYLDLSADDQHLGLPGGRHVTLTSSEVASNPTGAATPFDHGEKRGANATAGITRIVGPGTELIFDGGVRRKNQRGAFFNSFAPDFDSFVDSALTTFSLTPRMTSNYDLAGSPSKLLAGVDVYHSIFDSDRARHAGEPAYHRYALRQLTVGAYAQNTVTIGSGTDVGAGLRLQSNTLSARDVLDPNAPAALFAAPQGLPLDSSETQYAWHVGLEHRFNPHLAVFGRAARGFRLPNVDERVAQGPFGVPTTFDLKTQTSHDMEAGFRTRFGGFTFQSSAYLMDLNDEIFFSPATFTNVNLDPTRRYGVENIASWQMTDRLRVKAGLAYTRAVFREGMFAGNDVPLVSRWTGSAGVSVDVYRKYLTLDAVARFFGPRRMDNDSANVQPLIPGATLIDLRVGGEIEKFFWSFAVQNVFDVHYFEYAVASAFTLGTYNAYPLPGRTFLVKAGVTW